MALKFYGSQAVQQIKGATARGLLRAGIVLRDEHKARLSKSNPRPYLDSSKPGEYPKARTGFGRSSTTVDPVSLAEIERTMTVRVGYLRNAEYMAILEVLRGRLGLQQTLKDLRAKLAGIALGAARVGGGK